MSDVTTNTKPYRMKFDVGTIKHLGLQMYSTLPQVIGELVANSWDANATKVEIKMPDTPIDEQVSEIVIIDNGIGMSDEDVRKKYLIIGRDRREKELSDETPAPYNRKIMGRKGIGKFSAFGIAKEIVVESAKDDEVSHFRMNYDELMEKEKEREIEFDPLDPTGDVTVGTKVTLKYITKFKTQSIQIERIRQGLARRFAVIGSQFEVVINGCPISPEDRDLKRLLDKDMDGKRYFWKVNEEIREGTGWTVSGWIGALERTSPRTDKIERGIVLMARGKLVQEPFVFNAVVGQQFALSYLVGELDVEFVDGVEDTIGTTRNTLVWDTDANTALLDWGQATVQRIAREWGQRRGEDTKRQLQENELYRKFQEQAGRIEKKREFNRADTLIRQLIRQAIDKNPAADVSEFEPLIQMFLEFWEFDTFRDMAQDLANAEFTETDKLVNLFREWTLLEAREMARVTEGRITTIEKLQELIETNALEVPTVHNFLKEFPWVIDPRWTLVDDEVWYSRLLRDHFPENDNDLEENKRIDFLCVGEGTTLIVVEIKRPQSKARLKDLEQIERYVRFIRSQIKQTTDPARKYENVIGYLLCGHLDNDDDAAEKMDILSQSQIYVRRYGDLLGMVKKAHADFLERYNQLRVAKQNAASSDA